VINNKAEPVADLVAHIAVYNLDGSIAYQYETTQTAAADAATNLGPIGPIDFPVNLSAVHFIKLDLRGAAGKPISSNFYWQATPSNPDDLAALNQMPMVTLDAKVAELADNPPGRRRLQVTLHNPTKNIALMAHVQLRRKSGERVLPVFCSDNYVSLVPDETKTITIEAAASDFHGPDSSSQDALIMVDGWNVTVTPASFPGASVAPNMEAQPDRSPTTGLPFAASALP